MSLEAKPVESKSEASKAPASNRWHVGLVGYGEVGRILAEDLRKRDVEVSAYDIKLAGDQGRPLQEHAAALGVGLAASHADLAARVDFIDPPSPRARRCRWRRPVRRR